MTRSFAPVSSSIFKTCFQFLPPSTVLYTPRSPPGPHRLPVAATNTMSLFLGSMTIRLMYRELLRPTLTYVFPPSVDLYTPSPHPVLCRLFDSPLPTHTRSGLLVDTVTSPIDINPASWNCGSNEVPPFVVFHTPPCAAAT